MKKAKKYVFYSLLMCATAAGAIGGYRLINNLKENNTYSTKGVYGDFKKEVSSDEFSGVAYLISKTNKQVLLATSFTTSFLETVENKANVEEQQAYLGYTINNVTTLSNKYYKGISTKSSVDGPSKTWRPEDIFGSKFEGGCLAVKEITDFDITATYEISCFAKVGDEVLASSSKTIHITNILTPVDFDDFIDYKLDSSYQVYYASGYATQATKIINIVNEVGGFTMPKTLKSKKTVVNKSSKIITIGLTGSCDALGLTLSSSAISGTYGIKRDGNAVHIIANDTDGYNYAVNYFLERICDYDIVGCGSVGYNTESELIIPNFNDVKSPTIKYRRRAWSDVEAGFGDLPYNEVYGGSTRYVRSSLKDSTHNCCYILPPEEFYDSHSTWYVNSDMTPNNNQLCFTGGDDNLTSSGSFNQMIQEYATRVAAIFKAETETSRFTFTTSMQDNRVHCTCDKCTYYKNYYGAESATLIRFLSLVYDRIVSEKMDIGDRNYEDIRFNTLAYLNFMNAPTNHLDNVKNMCKHVDIIYAPIHTNFKKSLNDPCNEDKNNILKSWGALTNIELWLYDTNFNAYLYPLDTWEGGFETTKYLSSSNYNVNSLWWQNQHSSKGRKTGFDSFKFYLNSKAMLSPEYDYQTLKTRYFKYYFKDAYTYMETMFDEIVAHLRELDTATKTFNRPSSLGGPIEVPLLARWLSYATSTGFDENGHSVVNELIDQAEAWPKTLLERWVSICNDALNVIPAEDTITRKNVLAESIFPRYALFDLYEDQYTTSQISILGSAFKTDCDSLGIAVLAEGASAYTSVNGKYTVRHASVNLSDEFYTRWGL